MRVLFHSLLLSLLGGLLAHPVHGQQTDTTLARLIRQHQLPFRPQGGQFTGPGWERLMQELSQSQVVLLGEMHGTTQVPQFSAALAQVFKPRVFVAEISRYEAQDLTALVAQPGPPTTFLRQHPFALSFYSWAAEFALARQLVGQGVQLVGIDQVSSFTPGRFYQKLASLVTHPAAKQYLSRRAVAYQAHDRAVMGTNSGQKTLFQQSAATLDSLLALARGESPLVRQMGRDYVTSAHIYQGRIQPERSGQSHQRRVNLLKRNLLVALRPWQPTGAEPLPRLLFKFGDEHLGRNLSPSGLFDLGNLVVNLADAQDQRSLHLLVLGRQGSLTSGFNPNDARQNVATYSLADQLWLQPFITQAPSGSWCLIDLRPARRTLLAHELVATGSLQAALLGYDYLVLIPETTANGPF